MSLRIYFAWVLASIGLLVSFFFSEELGMVPCPLCWYQRICLYPLAIILGISAFKGSREVVPYIMPLIGLGFLFALYQVGIQEMPNFNLIDFCGENSGCREKIDVGLGPVSLPMLSALNFLVMALLLQKNRLRQ